MKFLISFILILAFANQLSANKNKDSLEGKNLKVLPLPLFWYTPETKFGGGVAALLNFRFNKLDTAYRVSSIQLGEAFTQEKQWINYLSFQLFPAKERYYFYGEAGYYRYSYFFYDVGNLNHEGIKEKYDIHFTRIRLNALHRTIPHLYAGIRYYFEQHQVLNLKENGWLASEKYFGVPKATTSSLGLVFLYDNRNSIFFPSKGWFAEFAFQKDEYWLGSSFLFSRFSFDVSKYFTFLKNHILAINSAGATVLGDAPFTQLSMFGGNHKMRGYYEGRFRDKMMFLLQAEARWKLFPRWHLATFIGCGWVSDKINHFQIKYTRLSAGIGLRFMIDRKQKINLRLDAARGIDKNKYYFTFNEAF